ncbi:UNVERIFIED_CONTAM: hypothetical protein NCL1_10284 [Trichonephila clavipes]
MFYTLIPGMRHVPNILIDLAIDNLICRNTGETPLRVKEDIEDVSSELGNGAMRLEVMIRINIIAIHLKVRSTIKASHFYIRRITRTRINFTLKKRFPKCGARKEKEDMIHFSARQHNTFADHLIDIPTYWYGSGGAGHLLKKVETDPAKEEPAERMHTIHD